VFILQVAVVVGGLDELAAKLTDDIFCSAVIRRPLRSLLFEVLVASVDPLPLDCVEGLVADPAPDQHPPGVNLVHVVLVLRPERKKPAYDSLTLDWSTELNRLYLYFNLNLEKICKSF
jgi:hypothetical protein